LGGTKNWGALPNQAPNQVLRFGGVKYIFWKCIIFVFIIFLKQAFLGTRQFGGGTKETWGGAAPECPPVATGLPRMPPLATGLLVSKSFALG